MAGAVPAHASDVAKRLGQACRRVDASATADAELQSLMRELLSSRIDNIADAQAIALWARYMLEDVMARLTEGAIVSELHRLLLSLTHELIARATDALTVFSGIPALAITGHARFRQ